MRSFEIANQQAFLLLIAFFTWFECNRTVLAQPSEQTLTQELPYKYYGHCISHKFHRPSCPFGMCISKRHLVLFHFRKDAIDAHYAPCKYCLPAVWWTVHGVILSRKASDEPTNKAIPENNAEEPDHDN